jgi:S-adenosylmethionine:tRNA ribosyltransferase-isomerase
MIGRASKWKEKILTKETTELKLQAELVDRKADAFIVEFRWQPEHLTLAEVLEKIGDMPIPPYLKRESEKVDDTRYQTIYAKQEGSVAAPTAGLHFTKEVFESLKKKQIGNEYVTLHVGAGTFKPVKAGQMKDHEMHEEWIEVSQKTIQHVLGNLSQTIIAVGTTSLRTLESIYWMGVKAGLQPGGQNYMNWKLRNGKFMSYPPKCNRKKPCNRF